MIFVYLSIMCSVTPEFNLDRFCHVPLNIFICSSNKVDRSLKEKISSIGQWEKTCDGSSILIIHDHMLSSWFNRCSYLLHVSGTSGAV